MTQNDNAKCTEAATCAVHPERYQMPGIRMRRVARPIKAMTQACVPPGRPAVKKAAPGSLRTGSAGL
jgi:hypothetical protein